MSDAAKLYREGGPGYAMASGETIREFTGDLGMTHEFGNA